jgi:hypothetical protein
MNQTTTAIVDRRSEALLVRVMVTALVAVVLVALAGTAAAVAADEKLPPVEKIIDRHIEATGGADAMKKLKNRVTTGTFEPKGSGIKLTMKSCAARPNLSYTLMESEATGKIEEGSNGDVVWSMSLMQGPQLVTGEERTIRLREAHFDKMLLWKKLYKKVECVGTEEVNGHDCYKVVFTGEVGSPITTYFDRKTYLAHRVDFEIENPMGKIPLEIYISDYKKVDGVLVAHRIVQKVIGQERIIAIDKIEHNVDLPKGTFDPPEPVQQLIQAEKSQSEGEG